MTLQKKIFSQYHSVHGLFLSGDPKIAQRWFNNLCKANYAKHLVHGRVLEIGCGRGPILHWLRSRVNAVEGIDLSPEDVEEAKKYTGIDTIWCVDAVTYLSARKEQYDCIIAKDVLEHVKKDDLTVLLESLANALKSEGNVILQTPNMDWLGSGHERYMDLTHEIGFTKESLGDALRLFFEDVSVYPVIYEFPTSFRSWMRIYLVKPLFIKAIRFLFTLLGEGLNATWFEYREILGTGKKKIAL